MNDKINCLALNDSGFIFDPRTGISYTTNTVGLEIIKMLREGMEPENIQALILEDYEVSPEEAERDILDFLELLKSKGFVE